MSMVGPLVNLCEAKFGERYVNSDYLSLTCSVYPFSVYILN